MSSMKPRFLADRLGVIGLVVGRERGVDYFRGLLSKTDKKEFSFRGIESKIVEDIQDEMRVIVDGRLFMADEKLLGTKDMKSCVSSAYRR